MKKILIFVLTLLGLCIASFAQVTIEGGGQKITLPNGKYSLTVGKQDAPTTTTPPTLPKCKEGLTLLAVDIAPGMITGKFHSIDVQSITYTVSKSGTVFLTGNTGQLTKASFSVPSQLSSGTYSLKIKADNCTHTVTNATKTFKIVNDAPAKVSLDPKIIYYNYDDTGAELAEIKLRVERRNDDKIYLIDDGIAPYISRYALNGSVNRLNPSELSKHPIQAGKWLHLVKFIADVQNLNTDGWRTSTQLTGGQNVKFAKAYECTFFVEDGTTPMLKYTQPLWGETAHRDGLNLSKSKPFSLKGKLYGSESGPPETETQLRGISWALGKDKYRLLYSAEVKSLTNQLGKGITDANENDIVKAADILAGMSGGCTYFAVDFEPHDPAADGWRWDYDAGSFRSVMQKLSKVIYDRHGKYFYSWIGKGNQFKFQNRAFELDGYSNNDWGNSLDTYISLHENPNQISGVNLASEVLTQIGFGYTSITMAGDASQPANKYVSPILWYMRALDVLNVQSLITPPNEKLLAFIWPYEDQPHDAKRTPMTRLKLGEGYIKVTDNRVQYPPNLVRDAVLTYLVNPKVAYTNYWIFGSSYDPYNLLSYAKINGVLSCMSAVSGGFYVSEYTGPNNPQCPQNTVGYMGKDALTVSAMIQAHEIYANHLQEVLDGTQVRDAFDFVSFTRSDGTEKPIHKNDTGEFARAYKYIQPWAQLWRNPKTGKRVLLFQDVFGEIGETISFVCTIDGKRVERSTTGNDLFFEII